MCQRMAQGRKGETMTREEAIEQLQYCKDLIKRNGQVYLDERDFPLLDIATEALSKPIIDITQRDLCADISCTDCPFMQETCKLMDYVAYADRPRGEWGHMIADGSDGSHWYEYECSHCGEVVLRPWNFCPNCGADMGGKA